MSSLSKALTVEWPTIAGISFVEIASSRGCNRVAIAGIVSMFHIKFHLLITQCAQDA